MNLFKVQFQELYERHLCRHSQYGINVIHLLSVIGSYLALFAIAFRLFLLAGLEDYPLGWLALPVVYLLLMAFNLPLRVLAATVVFVAGFFALFLTCSAPSIPIWVSLILFVLSHEIQQWSHKIYTVEWDMTPFQQKYQKGPLLFLILSLYELPILLNYLVFDPRRWFASSAAPDTTLYPKKDTGHAAALQKEKEPVAPGVG
jgi:hypothetical protein